MTDNKIREIRQIRDSDKKSKNLLGIEIMEIKETLITKFPRTMKLNKFVTLESGLRPKGGVGGILKGIPSLGGEHLNADGGFIFQKIKYIPEDFFDVLNKGHIYPNDIIVVKDGATTGKTSFVDSDFPHKRAVVNEHLFVVRVDPKVAFPKYVFYYLFSSEGQKQILSDFRGATVGGISRNFPQKVDVPIPSMPKQTQIANFLDRKTEQIDELICIKERRMELLQEQRTALINQAVTKGLDPNVEMKPSGMEWIGEIPRHWEIIKLRYLGVLQNGISKDSDSFGLGYPFLSYGDVYNNETLPLQVEGLVKSTKADRERYSVLERDVFFTRTSETIEDIGISSTCMKTIEKCVFSGFLIRFRNTSKILTKEFSKYYFFSHLPRIFLAREVNIVTRSSLSQELLKRLPVLLPPVDEQAQIANFLDHKTKQIDELIATEQRKIELLKEYRQSLISEAVTGKIDVRNVG